LGVKLFQIDIADLSKEHTLRFDVDFVHFKITAAPMSGYNFAQLFDVVKKSSPSTDEFEEIKYAEISNVTKEGEVIPEILRSSERSELNENYFRKIENGDIMKPEAGDVLISSVRPNLRKHVYIDPNDDCYYTKAFIQLRPKHCGRVLYYLLRTAFHENLVAVSRQGKSYPTLKTSDLFHLRFEKTIIDRAISKEHLLNEYIGSIEKEIDRLRSTIRNPSDIIDEIFSREFNFNIGKLEELRKISKYELPMQIISNNPDLRFSFRFHREAGYFVLNFLKSVSTRKIKDYLVSPIVLGKGISPTDYDENGSYFYISMADIKNWYLDLENTKTVKDEYYNASLSKTVMANDILLARSGEGTIGKVAIIEDRDIEGVFADFTMRIRVQHCNPMFVYCYFRTKFVQYLIYINKKGLGNNTNIFPSQIREFPMIDASSKKQQDIVDEINTELQKQRDIDYRIKLKRQEIEKFITDTLLGGA
jgi:hypothetical protein